MLGLGPLGVAPAHQGQGVGSALVFTLLGAPRYYRRFGFVPAREHKIRGSNHQWGDNFQARPLNPSGALLTGRFAYAEPFDRT